MRKILLAVLLAAGGCAEADVQPEPPSLTGAVLFQNARVIVGDGTVIENASFLVDGSTIAAIGPAAALTVPVGTPHVDLAGKTVMPAMIDAHAHLGYEGYDSWGSENYTRENLVDHLRRYAYYGFGAVLSTGTDPVDLLLELGREQAAGELDGARVLVAAGLAPPDAGPNPGMLAHVRALDPGIVRAAGTPEAGRAAVREIATHGVRFVKIWVDDRNGAQPKLAPAVFGAVIDEASHLDIEVIAHQQTVADMRELLAAGVDGFLHGRLGPEFDDGLMEMLKSRDAFIVPNLGLGERGREAVFEDEFLLESIPTAVAERLRQAYQPREPASDVAERQLRDAMRQLIDHDVAVVLGTDAGAVPDHFFGYTGHRELEIYTRLGMTPMQAIVAATGRAAEQLGLNDMGTLGPGMSADFIVLDANPLDDIRNTRTITDVYLRGDRVDREGLRAAFVGDR